MAHTEPTQDPHCVWVSDSRTQNELLAALAAFSFFSNVLRSECTFLNKLLCQSHFRSAKSCRDSAESPIPLPKLPQILDDLINTLYDPGMFVQLRDGHQCSALHQPPGVTWLSPVLPIHVLFLVEDPIQGTPLDSIVMPPPPSLLLSRRFLGLSVLLKTLTVLGKTGQVSSRMPLMWVCLMVLSQLE